MLTALQFGRQWHPASQLPALLGAFDEIALVTTLVEFDTTGSTGVEKIYGVRLA